MKHLVIFSHPNPKSFSHAILKEFSGVLLGQGNEVKVRDLYEIGFNPVLSAKDFEAIFAGKVQSDVKEEQDLVSWADVITFIYPIWWTGLPAIVKGYIDRVFSYGFAYESTKNGIVGKLSSKRVVILTPMGTPRQVYQERGMLVAMEQTMDVGIFKFCGIQNITHHFFGGVTSCSNEEREKMLMDIRLVARQLTGEVNDIYL
ncbi:MAG: NAD(P)H-dependent oxidoreductase [Bacteroidales bacterium]